MQHDGYSVVEFNANRKLVEHTLNNKWAIRAFTKKKKMSVIQSNVNFFLLNQSYRNVKIIYEYQEYKDIILRYS